MMGFSFSSAFALLATSIASTLWSTLVTNEVQAPYLDEVFHVRQAQVYCAGDFQTWDPKITTPPGLYLVSYLIFKVTGRCDIETLRLTNVATLSLIALECYHLLELFSRKFDIGEINTWKLAHTAINMSLFPPLFFFSGLYYTDLQSLLVVLLSIHLSLLLVKNKQGWKLTALQMFLGIASLFFRQTNIFWVAVFPIGLIVLDCLQKAKLGSQRTRHEIRTDFQFETFIQVVFELVVVALQNIPTIIVSSLPYFGILGLFTTFVAWNGGVVLGDKSNHVATIHVPQMLYIWPFICFFSFPIIVQAFFAGISGTKTASRLLNQVPRIWILFAFTAIALLVVHYNTIIHSFTLADNRHYVFYVFRVLRRHWTLRYLATPVYVICAWLSIRTVFTVPTIYLKKATAASSKSVTAQSRQRIAYILVWIVTSALSLVTAPLVEPRYFMIPWVLWRLSASIGTQSRTSLLLETAWYALVNVVTGYMFLYRTFEWKQEPGGAQRFMW